MSLLRGAAFDWFSNVEMRIGCPSDWATLRQAMLERFGSSIHSKRARVVALQFTQDKMIVLQYADAFESYLAQLEDHDTSLYLTKFIFGLRLAILTVFFCTASNNSVGS